MPKKVRKTDLEKLEKLIRENPETTQHELSKQMGWTRSAINRAIIKFDIPYQSKRGRPKKINISKLRQLSLDCPTATLAQLGAHFGCNKQAISQMLIKYDIPHVTRRIETRIAKLSRLIKKNPNAKLTDLAKELEWSTKYVSRAIAKHNIRPVRKRRRKRKHSHEK